MSVKHHFQQYFSYNVEVTFITGGNRRKSRTCRKSLTNFIMILRMNQLFIALFNLGFPFSILQSTCKYKSECEENVFLVSYKIC
jgi:hypothetical protein